ncbi:MAG: hypothetical protein VW683_09565 [Betaproteobacteria bacterium]|jgi:hypothetical protein
MSDYEQKDNEGVAFQVPKDQLTEEWMAPWTGKVMVGGKMYWVNMWDNTSKANNPYKKFKFKEMVAQSNTYTNKPKSAAPSKSFKSVDDIPWDD